MPVEFGPLQSVSEGRTIPGAPVTAVAWGTSGRYAVFIADPNGGVYTTGGWLDGPFGPWVSVSEGRTTPGGNVTAERWVQRFALFLADPNGGVYTTGGDPQGGFGPWASVSEGSTQPGAPVTAVSFNGRIALFLADSAGGIYTSYGDPQEGFGPWASVSGGVTAPGARVAALNAFAGGPIMLFMVNPSGGIFSAFGTPLGGWSEWQLVPGITVPPGSAVTASWEGVFQLTVVAGDGSVMVVIGDPERNDWRPWATVPGVTAPIKSPVTKIGNAHFVTDINGRVMTTADAGPPGWQQVSRAMAVPGTPIAVDATSHRREGADESTAGLSVFFADVNGEVTCVAGSGWQSQDVPGLPPVHRVRGRRHGV